MIRVVVYILVAAFSVLGAQAGACPRIDGLVDVNCDGEIRFAVTGDSIVRGVRDPEMDKISGGYVRDLEKKFPNSSLINLGVPGITSGQLYRAFVKNAPLGKKTYSKIQNVDYVLIEVGTNDYWEKKPALAVVRNIKRLRSYLRTFVKSKFGVAPWVFVGTVPPSARHYEQPFLESLNTALLLPINQKALDVKVRFDHLSLFYLSDDGLHPNALGYQKMASIAYYAMRKVVQPQVRATVIDSDRDGIYDNFEVSKFGTNPLNPDTDGDGLLDGQEVFKCSTSPLVVDTNGDGISDYYQCVPASSSSSSQASSSSMGQD